MGRTTTKIALIAAVSALYPTLAAPQQGGAGANPGGFQLDFGLSTTLKTDSNLPLSPGGSGRSYVSDTKLTFGLSSITSTSKLNVGASGILRWADIPGRSIAGFEDQNLTLGYQRDSANSRLTINGRYRNVDREFMNPFQVEREDQSINSLDTSGGLLEDTRLGLTFDTGLNAPIGFNFSLSHNDRNYSSLPLASSLFDTTTDDIKLGARLTLNSVTSLKITGSQTHYTANDAPLFTDRTTNAFSIGVTREIDPALTLDAQIGQTNVTSRFAANPTQKKSGVTASFGLTKVLPTGQASVSIANTVNQNGTRTTLKFGRDIQMATASLKATIGATKGSAGAASFVGSLAYDKQLANGTLALTFNRDASTNNQNQDIIDTRLGVAYGYNINSISAVNISFDWGRSEAERGVAGIRTIQTSNFTASYDRQINSDWTLSGGLTLRNRTETSVADANSNALFVTIGRNFSYRP